MNSVERILKKVEERKGEALQLLRELIAFDTTNVDQGAKGNEGKAQLWLRDHLQDLGMETRLFEPRPHQIREMRGFTWNHDYRDRPNLVGALKGKGGGRSMILNSHIDTMPFGPRSLWTSDPLGAEIRDDKIHGRGACDAKGCLASGIMAVRCLREAGVRLSGDVILESVVDEEGGGNGTLACIAEGYRADGAVVIEPTSLSLYLGHMGWMFFRILVRGKSTHSSIKWKGISAIEKGLEIVKRLQDLEMRWSSEAGNPLFPKSTINIGQISGGTAGSVVPDECEVKLCVHYYPEQGGRPRADVIESAVVHAIRELRSEDDWLRDHPPLVEKYQEGDPFSIAPESELFSSMAAASEAALGRTAPPAGAPYGCDARLLANAGGIPTVIFGPGSIEQAHSIDEYLSIEEYLRAIATLAVGIANWSA